jgi:hypothetical protein
MWTCFKCGEVNEDEIMSCQRCQTVRADLPPAGSALFSEPPVEPLPKMDSFATASLVLGLIPCTCIPSLLAIIFGHVALSRIAGSPKIYMGRNRALWGMGLGYFFTVCNLIYGIIVGINSAAHR